MIAALAIAATVVAWMALASRDLFLACVLPSVLMFAYMLVRLAMGGVA